MGSAGQHCQGQQQCQQPGKQSFHISIPPYGKSYAPGDSHMRYWKSFSSDGGGNIKNIML
jgi:hypothetical protein